MNKALAYLEFIHFLLDPESSELKQQVERACAQNPWFTSADYLVAINNIRNNLLDKSELKELQANYPTVQKASRIGLVLAGNIPLVGMHDVVCSILSGNHLVVKLSEKDSSVFNYLFGQLHQQFPETQSMFRLVDRLSDFDAVIATGSNNSSRYFEYYFGKYPHIIRKNRNAVAILTGNETSEDLSALGRDVYQYYGLGCRNVSKLYVPKDYDFVPLLEQLRAHGRVIDHPKYKNNYDYNLALTILNKQAYMTNESLIFLEDEQIASRIATIHYATYDDLNMLKRHLLERKDNIQCVVSKSSVPPFDHIAFGHAQMPGLLDYADGVDTMQFLTSLA